MTAYLDNLLKLALAGASMSVSMRNAPAGAGKESVPRMRSPGVDMKPGKPGRMRSQSKPRTDTVPLTQPNQGREIEAFEPPAIR